MTDSSSSDETVDDSSSSSGTFQPRPPLQEPVSAIINHLDDDDESPYEQLPQSTRSMFAYGPTQAILKRQDLFNAGTCLFISKIMKSVPYSSQT
jgi:hypothetical protein